MAGALAHSLLIRGEGRGVAGVRLEGWLRWSAHPVVVLGAGGIPCFCSQVFTSGIWVFGLFVSCYPEFAPVAHARGYF